MTSSNGSPKRSLVEAQHRAMPLTRLLDYGMDHSDAKQLLADTLAGQPWDCVAAQIADRQLRRARDAKSAGHVVTARQAYRGAAAALMFAQMAEQTDTPRKRDLYRQHVETVEELTEISSPRIERVDIDYMGGELLGWLCLPRSGAAEATVIVTGGLSGWGAAYLPIADALVERGVACMLAEGPGQGWPRLAHRRYLDGAVTSGFARFVDVIHDHPRLGHAIGVQGNSFGGLFAALLAQSDPRIGACVVNGAPARPILPALRTARDQITAALGTNHPDTVEATLTALRFDSVDHRIACPLLVLHGEADRLVTWEDQEPFLRAADPVSANRKVWADGEHTLYNHAAERNALTADWFVDALLSIRPATTTACSRHIGGEA